jgi:hypothetical protein
MKHRTLKLSLISSDRWLAYSIAGLATAAGSAPVAEAAIHYSGIVDVRLTRSQFSSTTNIPLSGGASLHFLREDSFVGEADTVNVKGAKAGSVRVGSRNYASNLRSRVNVSSGNFLPARTQSHRGVYLLNIYGTGNFSQLGRGFAAFKFDIGKGTQYGWMRVRTVEKAPYDRLIIVDYAWADPGETIETGQGRSRGQESAAAPAAGSLGLLAYGARGLEAARGARTAGTNRAAIGSGSSAFVLTPVSDPE